MAMYFRDENYYFCSNYENNYSMDILKLNQGGWGVGNPPKSRKNPPYCDTTL